MLLVIGAVADAGAGRLRRRSSGSIFVKVGAGASLFIVVAIVFAISADALARACRRSSTSAQHPAELGFALLLGALAFAGAGGGQNLCQSNWIRDKGFGMGSVRAAPGQPGDRRGGGGAERPGYIFEPTAGEHGALAAVVEASPTSSSWRRSCSSRS